MVFFDSTAYVGRLDHQLCVCAIASRIHIRNELGWKTSHADIEDIGNGEHCMELMGTETWDMDIGHGNTVFVNVGLGIIGYGTLGSETWKLEILQVIGHGKHWLRKCWAWKHRTWKQSGTRYHFTPLPCLFLFNSGTCVLLLIT